MPDIDRIIEQLLGNRRISEGAAFSTRSYADQPLIERGSDLKRRMDQRRAERGARHQQEAEQRQRQARQQRPDARQRSTVRQHAQGFADWVMSLDFDLEQGAGATPERVQARATPMPPVPEAIRQMRALEGQGIPATLSYGSGAASSLFWRQAQLMADYEDDYEFHGSFSQYYPTYASMSDHQLRGYFAWRTRIRAGRVEPAPLSFAFVYVYELLCGVGATPGEQALSALWDFGHAYRDVDEVQGNKLMGYLRTWAADYAIYHDVRDALARPRASDLGEAALTLLRAEHAQLRRDGRAPRIENPAATGASPTADQLFAALGATATYHLCEARLAKDEPELVRDVACDVFFALVSHCSKRRKTDYVEGLFGYASRVPYTMFAAAVFFDPEPHPDCTVSLGERETYVCKDGRWTHLVAIDPRGRNAELGLALHAVDQELRRQLDYPYPLKDRPVPKYLDKIVRDAVARRLEERAEAERRKITIDLSKLGGIRAAAALTQEALLTDDERAELDAPPDATQATRPPAAEPEDRTATQTSLPLTPQEEPAPVAAPVATPALDDPTPAGLSALEARVLSGLLEGTPIDQLLGPADPFVSVVVDTINERLFDLVGDAVIEFVDDEPRIIEDYLEDIREVLNP